jgi:hypothetical protein
MKYSEAFHSHKGKYSDKWSQYLDVYDRVLRDLDKPRNILEIGVQNGGSLEIWDELYPDAQKIIGVDIDPRCADLVFESPKISVIIGDAKKTETSSQILDRATSFDLIIDDGSHTSEDIIENFITYLPTLNPGALYIIEDLHASYWDSFGGSLFGTETAVAYLKRIIDALNHNHWNQPFTKIDLFETREKKLTDDFLQASSRIDELRFFDSIAVIRMSGELQSAKRQIRVSSGDQVIVNSEPKDLIGTELVPLMENRDSAGTHGRINSDEYLQLKSKLEAMLIYNYPMYKSSGPYEQIYVFPKVYEMRVANSNKKVIV